MRKGIVAGTLVMIAGMPTRADDLPSAAVYEAMLAVNKPTGWVQFRNYDGRQLVYFTPLQTLHCRLGEVRYSINSGALDERFELLPCDPQAPFSMPSNVKPEQVFLSLPRNRARWVAVQAVWEDGTESAVMKYRPCDDAGEKSCAAMVE